MTLTRCDTKAKTVTCTCGRRHLCSSDSSKYNALCKCRRKHYAIDDLQLQRTPITLKNSLFVIFSCEGQHYHHEECKTQLRRAGCPKRNIAVVYGFKYGRAKHGERLLRHNEIVEYGVRFRWLPNVSKLLAAGSCAAVWFVEADAIFGSREWLRTLIADFNSAPASKDILWPGWFKYRRPGQNKYYDGWTLQGCHVVVWRMAGLTHLHLILSQRKRFAHFDILLSKKLSSRIWWPAQPRVGFRGHWSITEDGTRQWREPLLVD